MEYLFVGGQEDGNRLHALDLDIIRIPRKNKGVVISDHSPYPKIAEVNYIEYRREEIRGKNCSFYFYTSIDIDEALGLIFGKKEL